MSPDTEFIKSHEYRLQELAKTTQNLLAASSELLVTTRNMNADIVKLDDRVTCVEEKTNTMEIKIAVLAVLAYVLGVGTSTLQGLLL